MSTAPFAVMAKPVGPVCNLSCSYCYYLEKEALFAAGERYRMSDEVLERYTRSVIDASAGPVVHFAWHGGEPTLAGIRFFQRVVEIQSRYLPDGWKCSNNIQTNGTLLDERWCDFLLAEGFSVGISIDGPAQLHDALRRDRRGRPTHARAMRGLNLLRERGIDPDVLCTLNALNVRHPREVYRFFLDQGVRWLQFLPVVRRSEAGVGQFQSSLHGGSSVQRGGALVAVPSADSVDPHAMGDFLISVFDEWVRHDVGRIAVQGFVECLLAYSGRAPTLCTMSDTCGSVLAMEHDGGVYSCDHYVDLEHLLGNATTDDIGELLALPAQLMFGASKRDVLTRACRECPVLVVCRGGCPKDRFSRAPDGEPGHNYLCSGYRAFYEHAAPYMKRMVALATRGYPVSAIVDQLRDEEASEEARWRETGRNDPCPCGSGNKYKQCCLPTRRPR